MLTYLEKFEQKMQSLHPYDDKTTFAVALSGGVDSFALLILCNIWSKKYMHNIVALTVDHSLRSMSASEAIKVGQQCVALGVEHHTLKWNHNGISSNVQKQARQARYRLLTEYCKQNDIVYLLTAHHLDDVIENFFIRLSDGSGSFGLCMQIKHYINNVCVLRPMIDFYKNDCIEIVIANNLAVVEDPTNNKTIYFRNEIRQKLDKFLDCKNLSANLFKNRILTSISSLNSNNKVLNNIFIEALVNSSIIYPGGYAQIELNIFSSYTQDNQFLILAHIITLISGKDYIPRHQNIANLMDKIFTTKIKNSIIQFTLHNCLIIVSDNILLICYDMSQNKHNIDHKQNRFSSNIADLATEERLFISYLSDKDYSHLRKNNFEFAECLSRLPLLLKSQNDKILRKKILFTLPVVKTIEKILAIPHINYYLADAYKFRLNKVLKLQFKPNFISKLTHYYWN